MFRKQHFELCFENVNIFAELLYKSYHVQNSKPKLKSRSALILSSYRDNKGRYLKYRLSSWGYGKVFARPTSQLQSLLVSMMVRYLMQSDLPLTVIAELKSAFFEVMMTILFYCNALMSFFILLRVVLLIPCASVLLVQSNVRGSKPNFSVRW